MLFDPYAFDLACAAQQQQQTEDTQAANDLPFVPQEARSLLWRGLREAVQGALALWEQTPPGVKREPPVFNIQHAGQPRFNPDDLRWQTLEGWHRLMGLELRLTAQFLEALILTGEADTFNPLLAEQYVRLGQLYNELKRRAGEWMAQALLGWELRLLRYRASPVVSPLIYG